MEKYTEIEFLDIEENEEYKELILNVVRECFKTEHLENANMYLNVILTNPENIRKANKEYRNIDKETDVLSFPMFEKDEIEAIISKSKEEKIQINEVLGDIIVSIPKVKEQAIEYGHSTTRELAYMIVHGFYHVMGYDHMNEEEKQVMREKEENVLNKLDIKRT
ncbi:MAG: rRNA maturation RNase YbeY [Clostridia bacterium]